MSQHLSDVIAEFEVARRAFGLAPNTLRNQRKTLDLMLSVVGNLQVRHVTDRHVQQFLAAAQARGHSAGTMNVHISVLRPFFEFARQRRYITQYQNPMLGVRKYTAVPKAKLRIPASRFGHLLASAPHPRDRALVAIGLFLFLRQSEAVGLASAPDSGLRLGDVNLDTGEISVSVEKTRQRDVMPISEELDGELRRWLTWYHENAPRPLKPSDYLLPAKARPKWIGVKGSQTLVLSEDGGTPVPDRRMLKPEHAVHRTLLVAGIPVRDQGGRSNREGMHTLRRSGARALFDHLVDDGSYDGALRLVQSLLHHSSSKTTEIYLGLDLDTKKRDELLRGKPMFPVAGHGNVLPLGKVGAQ